MSSPELVHLTSVDCRARVRHPGTFTDVEDEATCPICLDNAATMLRARQQALTDRRERAFSAMIRRRKPAASWSEILQQLREQAEGNGDSQMATAATIIIDAVAEFGYDDVEQHPTELHELHCPTTLASSVVATEHGPEAPYQLRFFEDGDDAHSYIENGCRLGMHGHFEIRAVRLDLEIPADSDPLPLDTMLVAMTADQTLLRMPARELVGPDGRGHIYAFAYEARMWWRAETPMRWRLGSQTVGAALPAGMGASLLLMGEIQPTNPLGVA